MLCDRYRNVYSTRGTVSEGVINSHGVRINEQKAIVRQRHLNLSSIIPRSSLDLPMGIRGGEKNRQHFGEICAIHMVATLPIEI